MALTSFTTIRNPLTGATTGLTYYLGWGKGSDSNDGTINSPLATLTGLAGTYVLRGKFEQNVGVQTTADLTFIGEQDAEIDGVVSRFNGVFNFYNLKVKTISGGIRIVNAYNCTVETFAASVGIITPTIELINVLIYNLLFYVGKNDLYEFKNLTILGFKNYINQPLNEIHDSIIAGNFDLYNYSNVWTYFPMFKNSLFIKDLFRPQFNGVDIPITWTTAGNEIQDVINSMSVYADTLSDSTQKDYLKACADKLFGEGCVVYDQSTVKVFNDDTYTLNRENGNPALYISSKKDYVGAYRPVLTIDFENTIQNIDVDGNVLSESADLLVNNNGIFANVDSDQLRNRVNGTNVIAFSNGDGFSKLYADFISSAANGWYLGMWQNYNADNPVIPFDQVELEFYDTIDNLSSYPKIAIPLNRDCEIYYHTSGSKAGEPVLFNDLADLGIDTNINLSEYGEWAVTNASAECVDLQQNSNIGSRKLLFRYVKPRLTLNRTQ